MLRFCTSKLILVIIIIAPNDYVFSGQEQLFWKFLFKIPLLTGHKNTEKQLAYCSELIFVFTVYQFLSSLKSFSKIYFTKKLLEGLLSESSEVDFGETFQEAQKLVNSGANISCYCTTAEKFFKGRHRFLQFEIGCVPENY